MDVFCPPWPGTNSPTDWYQFTARELGTTGLGRRHTCWIYCCMIHCILHLTICKVDPEGVGGNSVPQPNFSQHDNGGSVNK